MAAASDEADRKRFEEWMKKYKKEYSSLEQKEARFSSFKQNLRHIEAYPAFKTLGTNWTGLHFFSDMTFAEYVEHMGIDLAGRCYGESDDEESEFMVQTSFERESDSEDEYEYEDVEEEEGEGKGQDPVKRHRTGCEGTLGVEVDCEVPVK